MFSKVRNVIQGVSNTFRPGVLLILCLFGERASGSQYAFEITFTDKYNTPYSLSSPLAYLSSRSLARRTLQGIPLDSTDLPVNPAYVDSVLALTGGIFHETSKWLNMCMILLPAVDSAQIAHLVGKPFIKSIKEVGYFPDDLHGRSSGRAKERPHNSASRTTGADDDYYGEAFTQTGMIIGNYLHDLGYNGEGKLIAVLDAGFVGTDTHPGFDSLRASGRIVDFFDFTYHNTSVYTQDGHGTEVLSTMAGYSPSAGGYVGSAPKAMYALYITEYDALQIDEPLELDNLICGAERADSIGADVITESLGYDLMEDPIHGRYYPQNFDSLDGKTTVGARAANIATSKGILFVATAGNDGGEDSVAGFGQHITTPGDADSALTVGAVDISKIAGFFSGYGPNVARVVKPEVCAMGVGAEIFDPLGTYIGQNGTSFSTPQVAGFAACLMEANPTATPAQIKHAIIKCASLYPAHDAQLGYGVADFQCAAVALAVKDTLLPFTVNKWVIINPNPLAGEALHISVSPGASQDVNLRLTDMGGKEVFSFSEFMYQGYNIPLIIPVPEIAPGIYILKVKSATQQQVIKIEKR